MLLVVLSMILSFFSAAVMCYLSMATILGPWVAPVFVVVLMSLFIPFFRHHSFKESVIIAIAAGSIGGVLGLSVGLTWPSIYFLDQDLFELWMKSPLGLFVKIISLSLGAGAIGFLIAHFLREYLIVDHKFSFPMSQLVYNIVYVDSNGSGVEMLLQGVLTSSTVNVFTWAGRIQFRQYLSQIHMVPMLLSIGFVAGNAIAVPLLIGMVSRIVLLDGIRDFFFSAVKNQEFMVTFCSGMLVTMVSVGVVNFIRSYIYQEKITVSRMSLRDVIMKKLESNATKILLVGALLYSSTLFFWWRFSWLHQSYVFLALFMLSFYVSMVVARVGVVELDQFMLLIVLPLVYGFSLHSLSAMIVAGFCLTSLAVTVDLLFSYKLAHLANVPFSRVMKYQVVGFLTGVLSVGVIFLWYAKEIGLGSPMLFAQKSQEIETLINLGVYNPWIMIFGCIYALLILRYAGESLVVIGGLMMPVTMSFWFILAGAISYLVDNKERWYPFWFGVYASHSLWMILHILL